MFEPQHKPEYMLSCMQDTEERHNNKGAYIILQIPEYEEPEIHVFEAVSPRPKVVLQLMTRFLILISLSLFLICSDIHRRRRTMTIEACFIHPKI